MYIPIFILDVSYRLYPRRLQCVVRHASVQQDRNAPSDNPSAGALSAGGAETSSSRSIISSAVGGGGDNIRGRMAAVRLLWLDRVIERVFCSRINVDACGGDGGGSGGDGGCGLL